MQKYKNIIYRFNFLLLLIEGLFVFWHYLQNQSEAQSALIWGYSAQRLIFLVVVGFLILILFLLLMKFSWTPQRSETIGNTFDQTIDRQATIWVVFLLIGGIYLALFLSDHQLGSFASYRETLRPLFIWIGLALLQLLVVCFFIRGYQLDGYQKFRDLLAPSIVAFVILVGLVVFVSITRMGLTPDSIYWQEAGVPILLYQIFIALIAALAIYSILSRAKGLTSKNADFIIVVGLWIIASILWLYQPLKPAYNSLAPAPPNYQSYPFGDALRHDLTAQEFMLGRPIPPDFFVKPFYSFLLVLFHLVGGQNFNHIIFIQVVLLATIPPLTYLLTKELSTPLAGVIAALLMIFRERNAIALSNVIQVSNSRLLLSDVLVMGLMILLTWLLVKWSWQPAGHRSMPLAAGGVLGLMILTRGNPIVLFPFVLLVGLLTVKKMRIFWAEFFLPFVLGVMLVLLPWLLHNYQITGRLVLQDPSSPSLVQDQLAQLYTGTTTSRNMQLDFYQYLLADPLATFQFVSAHFFHNGIYSYIFLPQSFLIESATQYAKRLPFWSDWRGELPLEAWILGILHLSVLSIGFGSAWKKHRYAAFIPLIIGIGYNLSVALTRRSGWRFILPADWTTILYYSIGLGLIIQIGLFFITKQTASLAEVQGSRQYEPASNSHRIQSGILAAFFLIISIGVTQGHRLFSNQYNVMSQQDLVNKYKNTIPGLSQEFLDDERAVLLEGKGFYPIYFHANEGVLNYSYLNFSGQSYNRLAFDLVGDKYYGMILKTDTPPQHLPDGTELVVVGCNTDKGFIDVLIVLVESDPQVLYKREPSAPLNCPISEP